MKKRSATSEPDTQSQPEDWVYFTDRNLGKRFPAYLRRKGLNVRSYFEEYSDRDMVPDPEWLQMVGENGWVALTFDFRIRYKPIEKATIRDHGVRFFVFKGSFAGDDFQKLFEDAHARIERFLERYDPPFLAKIRRDPNEPTKAVVEMWVSRQDLGELSFGG